MSTSNSVRREHILLPVRQNGFSVGGRIVHPIALPASRYAPNGWEILASTFHKFKSLATTQHIKNRTGHTHQSPTKMKKPTVTVQINRLGKQSSTSAVDRSVSALLVAVGDMLVTIPIDICVGGQSITSKRIHNRKLWLTMSAVSHTPSQV